MIPLAKLARLPRNQRLRKILKVLTELELDLIKQADLAREMDFTYLRSVSSLLIEDSLFSVEEHEGIGEACQRFSSSERQIVLRSLNTLKHILRSAVGIQTADWDLVDINGNLATEKRQSLSGISIYLEDIRSPYNVGSLFRTAESFGVEKIYISALCASPNHPRAIRTSMGCVELVPWSKAALQELPRPLFALETGGTNIGAFPFPKQGTLIVGSEELGVSPEALSVADADAGRISIQTYGAKGSLNVSAAFAIAMHEWTRVCLSDYACFPV
ncbi:TrmH family RNA methyltransferase [Treponema sp.]